jgi:EmrB/QacA subfamily drug resistance transporter
MTQEAPVTELDSPEPVAHPHIPLAVVVAIACGAQFMGVFQESVVSVALPAMRSGLGLSTTDQAWVVNAYMITFGGFLLLAARASDLFGRKLIFGSGLALFSAAGIAAAVARSPGQLIGALFVQGIGAAAVAPASLSLITASHPECPERTRALTVWSTAATAAAPIGLVAGGALTSALSWRWVLILTVGLGLALLAAAWLGLAPSTTRTERDRLDLPGSLTVTLGAGALIYGVSDATSNGWGSAPVVGSLVAAAGLLFAFIVIETRSPHPLVPFGIFRNRSLSIANLVIAGTGVAMTAQLFFVSLYLQQIVGYSALRTGVSMVPMSVAMVVGVLATQSLSARLGARFMAVAGSVVAAAGMAWLSQLPTHSDYPVHVLGPTIVLGLGIGAMILPITEAATAGVAPVHAGLASGLFNVTRQIGGALGLSVLVTVATTISRHSGRDGVAAATVHGYQGALLVSAGISLAAALVSAFLPKQRD